MDRQRLDKWIWFARVVKTRGLATRLVAAGHVRVNGQRAASAAKQIGVGDVLTIALERQVRVLKVAALGERRGPYREASLLFADIGEPAAGSLEVSASACLATAKRIASARP